MVLYCTPTEDQNNRAEKKLPKLSWRQSLTLSKFQPESGRQCKTMPYCSISKQRSETAISSKIILDKSTMVIWKNTTSYVCFPSYKLQFIGNFRCRFSPALWFPFLVPPRYSQQSQFPDHMGEARYCDAKKQDSSGEDEAINMSILAALSI